MSDNAHEHTTVTRNGYEITFHPAFSGRCAITKDGTETELYKQNGVHRLPEGQTKPPTQHQVRLKGGQHNRDITLSINDPRHHIARIVVELYAEGHQPGWGSGDASVETLTVDNDTKVCPPNC